MVRHYNPSIAEDTQRIFNTKSGDTVSPEIMDKIQPVISIDPIIDIVVPVTKATTGGGVVHPTNADRDTYLTGLLFSATADVLATNTSYIISAFINGVDTQIAKINKQTLTAGDHQLTLKFKYPIKIDRGTNITQTSTFGAGAVNFTTTLYIYEEETTIR